MERISATAARRIALAAQGFTDPRPSGRVDVRHLRRVIERVGVLQLDSVNVFCRSHYLPLYSRLGPYPRGLLDELSAHHAGPVRRELVEYWAHMAALVPVERYPLFAWRMARAADDAWGGMSRVAREHPTLLDDLLERIERGGPIRSGQTGFERPAERTGEMWYRHEGKQALEYLFWAGRVMASRRVNFERWYDLPYRVLPSAVLAAAPMPEPEQQRELLRLAARSLGVATEPDLGDYYRLPREESKQRVAELVEAGELQRVEVEGWRSPAYLCPGAARPRRVHARTLLSPFDSLIWFRDRTERLFSMNYRIEIYVPPPQRKYGYYVLPFLLGDQLVARVDLKSDRTAGRLRVQSAWYEHGPGHPPREVVVRELAAELAIVAEWLDLPDGVEITGRGDLGVELAAVVI